MASINISEDDFAAVAGAARDAETKGDISYAKALDKIARKMNAALSHQNPASVAARRLIGGRPAPSWQSMPSTLRIPRLWAVSTV